MKNEQTRRMANDLAEAAQLQRQEETIARLQYSDTNNNKHIGTQEWSESKEKETNDGWKEARNDGEKNGWVFVQL